MSQERYNHLLEILNYLDVQEYKEILSNMYKVNMCNLGGVKADTRN